MKVLHVINNLGSGGAEKLLEDLIPLLNKAENVEADILLLTDNKNVFYESLIKKGVKVDVVKYRNIYDFRNIFEIKKHIGDGDYDIVHSHLFPAQYWVALSSLFIKNKKVKLITTEHSTYNRRREKAYFRFIDKFIYYRYDSIISITDKTKNNLVDWIGSSYNHLEKHIVIDNGVDINKLNVALPYKKSELIEGATENETLICMVGRFTEAKDQPTLIKAVSKLSDDIHLVLVGEGPLIRENEKLCEELGICDRVHFLGFRKDIPRILKTVDIVVLSSHWEGLSIASIEGLSSGKPFIASRVPGLEELVEGYGLLFEHNNPDELASIICNVCNDRTFYQEVSQKCLKRAESYNIETTVLNIVKLYTECLE